MISALIPRNKLMESNLNRVLFQVTSLNRTLSNSKGATAISMGQSMKKKMKTLIKLQAIRIIFSSGSENRNEISSISNSKKNLNLSKTLALIIKFTSSEETIISLNMIQQYTNNPNSIPDIGVLHNSSYLTNQRILILASEELA